MYPEFLNLDVTRHRIVRQGRSFGAFIMAPGETLTFRDSEKGIGPLVVQALLFSYVNGPLALVNAKFYQGGDRTLVLPVAACERVPIRRTRYLEVNALVRKGEGWSFSLALHGSAKKPVRGTVAWLGTTEES